jgi:putative flavoprotein involved in K+ transport
MYDVIVIGGGQAGLATGYHLKRAGLKFAILEGTHQTAGSWPRYYESLKLFSPARYSSLPGLPFPGDPERFPCRDEVIAYLRNYAVYFDLPVVLNAHARQISRHDSAFKVLTADDKQYRARGVIVATGSFNQPHLPILPSQDTFNGEILHSADYRQPETYRGKRVVVVGAGNSAVQIAAELATVANVTLSSRTPLKFRKQRILGRDIHFWLRATGIDTLSLPHWKTAPSSTAVLDTGIYRKAIELGKPDHKLLFRRFTPDGVIWADGCHEAIDTVLFATGYAPNVDFLANLGALNHDGQPVQKAGIGTLAGLYFVGLSGQRSLSSATLRGVGADARYVITHLLRYLRTAANMTLSTS